jgi:hypothetical protein
MLSSSSWIRQRVHAARRITTRRSAGHCLVLSDHGTTFSIIEKHESVQISVNGSTKILGRGDGISSSFTAKSAGQPNKKVSFIKLKLQLDTAVQEAVKNTVQETVAALAKNGWQKP